MYFKTKKIIQHNFKCNFLFIKSLTKKKKQSQISKFTMFIHGFYFKQVYKFVTFIQFYNENRYIICLSVFNR